MDLSYAEEYERFRHEVRAFVEAHRDHAPEASGVMGGRASDDLLAWQKLLIERGYAARTIPRAYGGYGGEPDIVATIIVGEEFARAGVPLGISGPGVNMLIPTLLAHGSEEQKQRWIAPTIRGELVWCQGYSEPGAGSDLANLKTTAREVDDDFLINGQKIWTSSAHVADMMFLLVRTEPDVPRHGGISYLLLPMDTPGIEVRPLRTMTGDAEFNQVFFSDVRVPRANLVGQRGEGWKIANTTLAFERAAAGDAGQMETMFQSLVQLTQAESRNGVSAIDDPLFRDRLLRLQARVLSMKAHSMRMLTCQLRSESPGVAGLVVKLRACELMHQMAALALDVMGELGALYHGSKYERAAGYWQTEHMQWLGFTIGGGTAQIQKNIIAERGLGLPREPKPAASRR
ncbi:MAG: acyl-CoA dehydrogenase family protein [Deltaproteobacteria bacterium]|nr:acyl-CoA dehydrogenase family protein [Deltaproteobacteria bacterium]MBW2361216.1 acyl-CoA dehydrogenase family protein [Deltaproteobacteria bacterium]